jgi:hypothetical protein
VGLLVGVYFIGYNVGKNGIHPVTAENDNYSKISGVYKRSYYNNYNVSVDSYAILRDDGSCKYIESLKTELSTTVDFNDRSQNCKYTYDEGSKSGKIEITYESTVDGKTESRVKPLNFTFKYGSLMIGGASYGRIQ